MESYSEINKTIKNKNPNIKCIPAGVILEFCMECDKITPFIRTLKCTYCGCDSLFGEFYDDTITEKEMNNYLNQNTIYIGEISKDTPPNIIEFLNQL